MRWLPIETAPKDRIILLRDPMGKRVGGWRADEQEVWATDVQLGEWYSAAGKWYMTDPQTGGCYEASPTHWFDIPGDDEGFA